ncbi:MAG: hypothetical protein HWD58_09530 [Bacteroidota bacterium]|nr:MAG: hypothetical protein HWD58_09530 [Bacteroidota bacterium]
MPVQNQDKVEVNGLTTGRYLVQPAKDKSIMQKLSFSNLSILCSTFALIYKSHP